MANIQWTAVTSNPEWMIISAGTEVSTPTDASITGEGDTYIEVSVTPMEPGSAPEIGTITITGPEDEKLVKVIEVQRCGNGCGCDKLITAPNNRVVFKWDDDSDTKATVVDMNNCVEENLIKFNNTLNKFTLALSETNGVWTVSPNGVNEEDDAITETLKVQYGNCPEVSIDITQNSIGCGCGNVHCGENYTWSWDKKLVSGGRSEDVGQTKITVAAFDDCVDLNDITLTREPSGPGYNAKFNVINSNRIVTVFPVENNAGNDTITETLKIKYNLQTKDCPEHVITLNQTAHDAFYIRLLVNNSTIPCNGGSAEIKYYLSYSADGDESTAITDDIFLNCLSFTKPEGVTCTEPVKTNGVYKVNATFARNAAAADMPYAFTVTCPSAQPSTKTEAITQLGCDPLYIHVTQSTGTVEYSGGYVIFRYYLSNFETDDETKAIRNPEGLMFLCPSGIQFCGNETISNGVYERKVTFGVNTYQGGEEGKTWEFTTSCSNAVNDPVISNVYQANKYEKIIPNCDYFSFSYSWTSQDGRDLDSLTHITNLPNFNIYGNNISGQTVGYDGTSSNDGKYLKFGGDNRCNGSEYTIVCLKQLLLDGKENQYISENDVVYIDVYGAWYGSRGNGKMGIKYEQFTGHTSGGFDEEMVKVKHTECESGDYYSFAPKNEAACTKIGEAVEVRNLSVNADGDCNHQIARSTDCINGAYTFVFRLKYDVGKQITTFETGFTDSGIAMREMYFIINGAQQSTSYSNYVSEEAHTGSNKIKYRVFMHHIVNGGIKEVGIFDSQDDYLTLTGYTYDSSGAHGMSISATYTYQDFASGVEKDFGDNFIRKFKVERLPSKMVDITFEMDALPSGMLRRDFDFIVNVSSNYILPCSKVINFGKISTAQKP